MVKYSRGMAEHLPDSHAAGIGRTHIPGESGIQSTAVVDYGHRSTAHAGCDGAKGLGKVSLKLKFPKIGFGGIYGKSDITAGRLASVAGGDGDVERAEILLTGCALQQVLCGDIFEPGRQPQKSQIHIQSLWIAYLERLGKLPVYNGAHACRGGKFGWMDLLADAVFTGIPNERDQQEKQDGISTRHGRVNGRKR